MWCFSAVQLHLPLNPILHSVLKCQCCCTGGQVQSRHSHILPAWMHYCECACVLKSSLSFVQEAEGKPQTVVICSICQRCLQTAHYLAKQSSALRVVCDLQLLTEPAKPICHSILLFWIKIGCMVCAWILCTVHTLQLAVVCVAFLSQEHNQEVSPAAAHLLTTWTYMCSLT